LGNFFVDRSPVFRARFAWLASLSGWGRHKHTADFREPVQQGKHERAYAGCDCAFFLKSARTAE